MKALTAEEFEVVAFAVTDGPEWSDFDDEQLRAAASVGLISLTEFDNHFHYDATALGERSYRIHLAFLAFLASLGVSP